MSILEALALYRKLKPLLDLPWVKKVIGWITFLLKKDESGKVDTTPELPRSHPDRPVTLDDIQKSENNPAG